jgi:hypothetical protein
MAGVYTDQRLNLSKLGKAFGRKPGFQTGPGKSGCPGVRPVKLVCSAGDKPAGAKVRRPVVWIAGWRETEILKPIDRVSRGGDHESSGRNDSERKCGLEKPDPRAEPASGGRRQNGVPKSDRCGIATSAG